MQILKREQIKKLVEIDTQRNHYDISSLILSQAVGLYEKIIQDNPAKVLIACGNNLNGDCGLLLADLLKKRSKIDCEVIHYCLDNRQYCSLIKQDGINVYEQIRDIKRAIAENDYIIDCIYGIDLQERVFYPYDLFIEWINNKEKGYILSCDIPSGLNCDNGTIYGICIKATETLSWQLGKVGMYLYPGNTYCGKITIENIGISYQSIEEIKSNYRINDWADIKKMLPPRYSHSHKGTYGKVLLIAGSEDTTGAAILCGKTILKTGAGLLTVMSYPEVITIFKQSLPEAMTVCLQNNIIYQMEHFDFSRFDLIVIGPGLSRSKNTEILLQYVLKSDKNVLIDADGLFYLKNNLSLLKRDQLTVITPHLIEYQRIFAYDSSRILEDLASILKIYQNLIIVLKSENTIIAYRDEVTINTCGNNALAKGGSGDVLAGCISGFLAQRSDLNAVIAAVYVHSFAADLWVEKHSPYSLLASDLIGCIDEILYEAVKEKEKC